MLTSELAEKRCLFFSEKYTTEYEYDNQRRLIGLVNHRNQNFNFEYDSANRVKKIITPVMESSMSFDSTNFLTSLIHTSNSGTVINSFEYVRDALGNRIQMRTPTGDFNFGYDQNSQLTNSQSPEIGVESFSYDPLGNRITDQSGNYIYDSKAQRLVEDYQYLYNYDDNGNLSSKVIKDLSKTENYIHDSQNRMVEFAVFEGSTKTREVKYFYDALGRRIRKVSNDLQYATSKITNYLYEGNEVIAKTDDSNQVLVSFTHSRLRTDDPLAMHVTTAGVQAGIAQSSEDIFYAKDAQGSVIDLVDSNGDLIEHYSYGSFGKLLKITDANDVEVTNNPIAEPYFAYTAREFDTESGLYYYRARYYDSSVGRFIEIDPHPGLLKLPSTFVNKYVYANNNPVMKSDPNGRFPFIIVAIILSGAITGAAYEAKGGSFLEGFALGALSSAVVFGGAYVGAAALGGGFSAAAAGGTAGTVIGGTLGGAVAGGTLSYVTGGTGKQVFLGALFGGLNGLFLGILGFGGFGKSAGAGGTVSDVSRATAEGATLQLPFAVPMLLGPTEVTQEPGNMEFDNSNCTILPDGRSKCFR